MLESRTINISTGTILKAIIIILGLWFLYFIRDILAIFFIAIIITAGIEPLVDWMEKRKIPRSIGVLIIYIILAALLGLFFSFFIPPLVAQATDFFQNIPVYIDKLSVLFSGFQNYAQSFGINFNGQEFFNNLAGSIPSSPSGIFSTTIGFFSGILTVIIVFSLTFYLSVKKDGLKKFIVSVTPSRHEAYVTSLTERIKNKIGRWLQGQLFLMLLIFVMYFLALYFLKIPYALILALFGGILEIIPYLGPILSTIPVVLLGFLISPLTGLLALGIYICIQQIEGHIFVPQVMKKALGLNPVIVILALIVGIKLGGIIGGVLAIPIATALDIVYDDLTESSKKEESVAH